MIYYDIYNDIESISHALYDICPYGLLLEVEKS
jgi:hypothetical protein